MQIHVFWKFFNCISSRKKLRDIEALEAKLASGEISAPEPEQLEKVRPICICQNPICDFFCILRLVENTFLSGVPESWCDGGDRSLGEDGGVGVSNSI